MTTSSSTVGTALASAVANRLQAGQTLAFSHPEYCGVGLGFADGVFIYGEVYDGQLTSKTQFDNMQARGQQIEFLSFATAPEFIAWLAAQTDDSLSGRHLADTWLHGNQRLSLARLQEFVA